MSVFRNRRTPEATTLRLSLSLPQRPSDSREARRGSL